MKTTITGIAKDNFVTAQGVYNFVKSIAGDDSKVSVDCGERGFEDWLFEVEVNSTNAREIEKNLKACKFFKKIKFGI